MELINRSDLELVLAVQRGGSLTAAALSLDVAPPAVTKRLAALEARLGQRLFVRTTRRVSPTAEGEAVCRHAQTLLSGFGALEADLRERQGEPSGLLRIAATFGFGRLWLGPALAQFQASHPRLTVQLQLTEQLPDLAAEGFDGAVWLWSVPRGRASQWTARRLAGNRRVLAAAPAYLARRGTPDNLHQLAEHDCLVVRENEGFDTWSLQRERDKTVTRVRVGGPLSSNSGELVRDWCLDGRGIMLRSLWDIAPQLASGQLHQVLPTWTMHDADIHWLAPWQPRQPKRMRLLADYLSTCFRAEPWRVTAPASQAAPPS